MCALASVKFLTGSAKALTHLKSSSFRRVVVVGGMGLLPASSSSNDVSNGSSRKLSWPQLGNPSEELEDGFYLFFGGWLLYLLVERTLVGFWLFNTVVCSR